MKFNELVKTIFFVEILKGLKLTLSRFFSKPVTRRYPKVKRPAALGYRGLHALVPNPTTGEPRCVGCGLCVAVCPSRCISIYTSEGAENQKIVDRYEIEVLRCTFCALCVEACPYGAIVLTPHYEYSNYSRDDFYMTKDKLLKNWEMYMGEKGYDYFDKFWNPRSTHFKTPMGQPLLESGTYRGVEKKRAGD
jgi:NADH-quinone oxidoreductase subunit I